jgi:pimeloyl-ACP methyl ester carboxylesterase
MKLLIGCITISLLISIGYSEPNSNLIVRAQPNGGDSTIPVLLIHGYASDPSVWNEWEEYLNQDNIPYELVTFSVNDSCGSSDEHAQELHQIINDFKMAHGVEKINIVAHSKGGLDARVHLANNPLDDSVANLIMIGTPNKGSPMADRDYQNDPCKPAIFDLLTNSSSLDVPNNTHTKYYTIAGNWVTQLIPWGWTFIDGNCIEFSNWYFYQSDAREYLDGPDDGIVPIWSAQPNGFIPLDITDNCHTYLLNGESYGIASEILKQ